jgi:hydrogenase maturation factor
MNLVYGEVVDLSLEQGMRIGTVRISGALKKVPLDLVIDAQCGDKILMCNGVAIGKVNDLRTIEKGQESELAN